jgi:uncharacterized protein
MDELSFIGYKAEPIKLEPPELLVDFLNKYPQPLAGYTFATLAAWQSYYQYAWHFAEPETLFISCILEPDQHRHLLQPLGEFPAAISQKLLERASALPYPLKITGASENFIRNNPDFSRSFSIAEDRSVSNYLYSAELLSQLPGRKYSKKRNLLAQASSLYQWSAEPLTGAMTISCFEVLDSIIKEEHPLVEGMLARELTALEYTLRHFDELHQRGLLLFVAGRPVAFSIYEAIGPTTVAIHFERALRSYKGLYQVINWETAKVIAAQGFQFINREEDLGDPGLRDAKLSYHPIQIIPAYELVFNHV